MVATLHPDHTWQKVVVGPWRQVDWDVSDTVLVADPRTDANAGDFFARLPTEDYLPTWHQRRIGGALGPHEQDAASKAGVNAATPTVSHADPLGRTFLTVAHNRLGYRDLAPADEIYRTRAVHDIEGNLLAAHDERLLADGTAQARTVLRYDYDLLGGRVHQASMESGERWTLHDVTGKPVLAWDGRGHRQTGAGLGRPRSPAAQYLRRAAPPGLGVPARGRRPGGDDHPHGLRGGRAIGHR